MKKEDLIKYQQKALEFYQKANIVLTPTEIDSIEVADFGLNCIESTGLQLVTYINTSKCCAKEMVLLPYQTCPEHRHAPLGDYDGKEETFRCRMGKVYLYVQGEPCEKISAKVPELGSEYYSVFQQIILEAGEQYTIYPDTKHWFQAGADGAVISEFSTSSFDEFDIFTNPNIQRITKMEE